MAHGLLEHNRQLGIQSTKTTHGQTRTSSQELNECCSFLRFNLRYVLEKPKERWRTLRETVCCIDNLNEPVDICPLLCGVSLSRRPEYQVIDLGLGIEVSQ